MFGYEPIVVIQLLTAFAALLAPLWVAVFHGFRAWKMDGRYSVGFLVSLITWEAVAMWMAMTAWAAINETR